MAHSNAAAKAALRSRARARRHDAGADRGAAARLLATARSAGLLRAPGRSEPVGDLTIAAYIASPREPDVAAIRSAVRSAGGRVLLPTPTSDRRLSWAFDTGRYTPHPRLPVAVPAGPAIGTGVTPLLDLAAVVLFMPALAVDRSGGRLGQGGGYYDQLLAELGDARRDVRVVAVVRDDEVLDAGAIPIEEHDQRVTEVLTPTRLMSVAT